MEAYYLYQGDTQRMLWTRNYDEDYGTVDWRVVKCPRKGLRRRDAAMMLLAACLDRERRKEGLERFHFLSPDFKKGLLSEQEINAVADVVWGGDPQEPTDAGG